MKLFYIVNININNNTARSVQVKSNSISFFSILGDSFKLVTPDKTNYPFSKYLNSGKSIRESSKKRKIIFHFKTFFFLMFKSREIIIYSRNISIITISSLLGYKCIWEAHDKLKNINIFFLKYLLSKKIKIVSISKSLKNYLVKAYNLDKEKVLVAHDGVFVDRYDNYRKINKEKLREDLKLPTENNFILMHTGSLYEGRGIELFEIILKKFNDIYMVQVGGTEEDIEKWKSKYGKYKNMIFFGHQSNDVLIKFQMCADLLFLPMTRNNPIWWCTSPMKLFEYMATGKPILSTNIGSISEVLNEMNSIQFDPSKEDSLVNSITNFIKNPEIQKKISETSLINLKENYTWEIRSKKIINFIGLKDEFY